MRKRREKAVARFGKITGRKGQVGGLSVQIRSGTERSREKPGWRVELASRSRFGV